MQTKNTSQAGRTGHSPDERRDCTVRALAVASSVDNGAADCKEAKIKAQFPPVFVKYEYNHNEARIIGYKCDQDTREQAESVASDFPKSHRVFSTCCGDQPYVGIEASFSHEANATCGERNEAGELRLARFVKKAQQLGYRIKS